MAGRLCLTNRYTLYAHRSRNPLFYRCSIHETQADTSIRLFAGNWKAVYLPSRKFGQPSRAGSDKWELFDLDKDPGEIYDLSEQRPDIQKELMKLWDQYVLDTGVIPLNPALGEYIAATEEQMPDDGWMEYEFWKKGARDDPQKFFKNPKRFDRQGKRVEYVNGTATRV